MYRKEIKSGAIERIKGRKWVVILRIVINKLIYISLQIRAWSCSCSPFHLFIVFTQTLGFLHGQSYLKVARWAKNLHF